MADTPREVLEAMVQAHDSYLRDHPYDPQGQVPPSDRRHAAMQAAFDARQEFQVEQANDLLSRLTSRQRSILERLAEGMTYKQIALDLGLGASTIRTHLSALYKVLDVHDRGQAIVMFMRARDEAERFRD